MWSAFQPLTGQEGLMGQEEGPHGAGWGASRGRRRGLTGQEHPSPRSASWLLSPRPSGSWKVSAPPVPTPHTAQPHGHPPTQAPVWEEPWRFWVHRLVFFS